MSVPVTQRFDFNLMLGTTFNRTIGVLYDPDTGDLFDLSGYEALAQVRRSYGHYHPVLVEFSNDMFTLSDQGEIKLKIPHDYISTPIPRGVWDLILTKKDEDEQVEVVFVAITGLFTVIAPVTKEVVPTPDP